MIHGTASAYQHHGCRCEACRAHQAAAMRSWRQRGGITRQMARDRERQRALAILRDRHRDEYEAILADVREVG